MDVRACVIAKERRGTKFRSSGNSACRSMTTSIDVEVARDADRMYG
jgi:hypothetical protein